MDELTVAATEIIDRWHEEHQGATEPDVSDIMNMLIAMAKWQQSRDAKVAWDMGAQAVGNAIELGETFDDTKEKP